MEVFGLLDIPLTLVLMVLVIVLVYVYQTWHFNTWTAMGIPGPKPRFLFGTISMDSKADMMVMLDQWKEQYGRTYGIFVFRDPVLLTSDPEFIKEVAIKNFNDFTDRYSGMDRLTSEFTQKMLFHSNGRPWKRYRHVISPAFSTGKLKALQGYMIRCSEILSEVLRDKARNQEDIDLKDVYKRFTMDVIAGTAFGLDTSLQRGEGEDTHDMIRAMQGLLSNLGNKVIILLAVAFPCTAPLLRAVGYTQYPVKDRNFFGQCITAIIREREAHPQEAKKRVDFLQQMMDVRVAPGEEVTDVEEDEFGGTKSNKKMTEEEVVAQGIQVFLAGFETTSTTLHFLTYSLATHPEVQETLYLEIMEVVGQGEVKYEHLQQLKYTECVILETLRMYPVLPVISRLAKKPMEIQGFTIPKGMGILLSVYTATHDPDIYPDPHTFQPDRFLDGKDSLMSSLPFGVGPRQCIGMRLAMQEMKTALVYICKAVRFVPCHLTPKTLELDSTGLLTPKQPVIVRAEVRT